METPGVKFSLFTTVPREDREQTHVIFYPNNSFGGSVEVHRSGEILGRLDKFSVAQINEIIRFREEYVNTKKD